MTGDGSNRLTSGEHQRSANSHIHTKEVPISRRATVQVEGLACMRSHGRASNVSYPLPRG